MSVVSHGCTATGWHVDFHHCNELQTASTERRTIQVRRWNQPEAMLAIPFGCFPLLKFSKHDLF